MFFKKLIVFLLLFFGAVFAGAQENQVIFPEKLKTQEIPKLIIVSLKEQLLANYHYGQIVSCYPISSGMQGRSTPIGKFEVIDKNEDDFSWTYNSPMPWALKLTERYLIHAGELPGYPASHGCIRLSYENAQELYNWTEIGTPVWIIRSLDDFAKK